MWNQVTMLAFYMSKICGIGYGYSVFKIKAHGSHKLKWITDVLFSALLTPLKGGLLVTCKTATSRQTPISIFTMCAVISETLFKKVWESDAAGVENSIVFPHKIKHRITVWSDNSTSVCTPKISEQRDSNRYLYTMCIAALVPIASRLKQPRCPLADEWIHKMWYILTMEYYSCLKKEANTNTCYHMGGPWRHYVKWYKPVTKGQMLCGFTYMRHFE